MLARARSHSTNARFVSHFISILKPLFDNVYWQTIAITSVESFPAVYSSTIIFHNLISLYLPLLLSHTASSVYSFSPSSLPVSTLKSL